MGLNTDILFYIVMKYFFPYCIKSENFTSMFKISILPDSMPIIWGLNTDILFYIVMKYFFPYCIKSENFKSMFKVSILPDSMPIIW